MQRRFDNSICKALAGLLAIVIALVGFSTMCARDAYAIENLPKVTEQDLSSGAINGTNWMSGISGERYLNEITIPGTHDSGMEDPDAKSSILRVARNKMQKAARTQTLTIPQQLNAGVRMFDLRLTEIKPNSILQKKSSTDTWLCHGPRVLGSIISCTYYACEPNAKYNGLSFNKTMEYYAEFLRQHPTETIIVSVTNESGAGDKTTILKNAKYELDKWAAATNPSTGKPYLYMPSGTSKRINTMPKLADTRGQIIIVSDACDQLGYGMQMNLENAWNDNGKVADVRLSYENHYEATNEDKVDYVRAFYKGGTVKGQAFSAQKGVVSTRIEDKPLDYLCNVYTTSNRITSLGWVPKSIADYVNPRVFAGADGVFNTRGVYYGWVSIDFIDETIAKTVWMNNYPSAGLEYASIKFVPGTGSGQEVAYNVQAGTKIELPQNMYNPGNQQHVIFGGWKIDNTVYQPGETVTISKDTVITAHWKMTWSDLQKKILEAKAGELTTISLTDDVVAEKGDTTLLVPRNKRIVIELNGHTIHKKSSELGTQGSVFNVNGALALKGAGTITGGLADRGAGIRVNKYGSVTLKDVTITGNVGRVGGAGVYVSENAETTSPLLVAGSTIIKGNTLEGGSTECNVFLSRDTVIKGVGSLTDGSYIGVSSEFKPTCDNPVVISSMLSSESALSYLHSECDYAIMLNEKMQAVFAAPYQVTFDTKGANPIKAQLVLKGGKVKKPTDPQKAFNTFNGWYVAGTPNQYDFDQPVTENLILEAHWKPLALGVSFDSDGGSAVPGQSVDFGRCVTKPADPTREGYTFVCWKYKYSSTHGLAKSDEWAVFDFTTPVTRNLELKATWNPKTCTVTFDSAGGSPTPDAQKLAYGETATRPADPTRENCTFLGWYEGESDNAYNFFAPVKDDVTLTAKWRERPTYTVKYDLGYEGATAVLADQKVLKGRTAPKPDNPTRAGYVFECWQLDGAPYGFYKPVLSNLTLTASWTRVCTVTYDSDGGSYVAPARVVAGNKATDPGSPSRNGYVFTGWYNGDMQWNFAENAVTDDLTLTAGWRAETYTVTFDSQGGTQVSSQSISYGQMIDKSDIVPTNGDKLFAGWYKNAACTQYFDFSTPVTGDLTLYAKWVDFVADTVIVTFDTAGGTAVDPQQLTSGDVAAKPADPTREGYAFTGWRKNGETTDFDFSTAITENVTLVAQWQVNTYTVSFVLNYDGAIGAPDSHVVAYGGTANKPADPSREGHAFSGWCVDAACTQTYDFDAPVTGDVTLYASWALVPVEHVVVFDSNGGSEVDSQKVLDGEKAVRPAPAPTRAGHELMGWYKDAECSQEWDFDTDTVTADTMLYAQWKPTASYQVTFDSDNGSAVASQSVLHGSKATKPSDPAKDHYAFEGWYIDDVPYDFDTPVTGPVTLKAHWTLAECVVTFDGNGASSAPDKQIVAYGGFATDPGKLSKEGSSFEGWYIDIATLLPSDSDFEETKAELLSIRNDHTLNSMLWVVGDDANGYTLRCEFDFATDYVEQDTTLYARWVAETHAVSFEANGGANAPASQQVEYGKTATEPDVYPTRDHYYCTGWYTGEPATVGADPTGSLFNFSTPVIGDIVLYAGWAPDLYLVEFDTRGGSSVDYQIVSYNEKAEKPDVDPVLEDARFAGWYADSACTSEYDFDAPIVDDTVIYARWNAEEYDVTFEPDGGLPAPDSQTVAHGSTATKPTDPAREGFTFGGWYAQVLDEPIDAALADEIRNNDSMSPYYWVTDDNYVRVAYDFDTCTVSADITLYARWYAEEHTVTFDAEGGAPVPASQSVAYGSAAQKPSVDPEREGYAFAGWYEQLEGTIDDDLAEDIRNDADLSDVAWVTDDNHLRLAYDFATETVTEDETLYARWTPNINTVTFVDELGATIAEQKVASGKAPMSIDGEASSTTEFIGWYADAARTMPYDFSTPILKDVTVYGKWELRQFTVKFDSEGGSEVTPNEQQVVYGECAERPTDPVLKGYAFKGWYEDYSNEMTPEELEQVKADLLSALPDEDPEMYAEFAAFLEDALLVVDDKVMVAYDPESDPVWYDMTVQAVWQQGSVVGVVVEGEGAPKVTVSNLDAAAQALATDDEVAQGVLVELRVNVLDDADVPAEDKSALKALANERGITFGQWIDMSVYKTVGNGSALQVREIPNPMKLSVTVPDSLQLTSDDVTRTFYLLRMHDGEASVLAQGTESAMEADNDKFSTYMLGYADAKAQSNPSTDDETDSREKASEEQDDETDSREKASEKQDDAAASAEKASEEQGETTPSTAKTSEKQSAKTSTAAKTGDMLSFAPYVVVALVALVIAVAAWAIWRKKK